MSDSTFMRIQPSEYFARKFGQHFSVGQPIDPEKIAKARRLYSELTRKGRQERRQLQPRVVIVQSRGHS